MSFTCTSCLRAARIAARNASSSTRYFSRSVARQETQLPRCAIKTPFRPADSSTNHYAISRIQTRRLSATNFRRTAASTGPTTHQTTTPALRTVAILNPRKDPEDESQEMTIELTARACKRLRKIMSKDSNPDLCLRISVESGGCHGFQYLMSLTSTSKISQDEDTLFVAEEPGYDAIEGGDSEASLGIGRAKCVMDEASLELLKGSKVDFSEELIGSQFLIVDNPRAVSSCGCGTSFDVKI